MLIACSLGLSGSPECFRASGNGTSSALGTATRRAQRPDRQPTESQHEADDGCDQECRAPWSYGSMTQALSTSRALRPVGRYTRSTSFSADTHQYSWTRCRLSAS